MTNDDLQALRDWARKNGKAPTREEWKQAHGKPGATTLVKRYGSWANAVRSAGLAVRPRGGGKPKGKRELLPVSVIRPYVEQACVGFSVEEAAKQLRVAPRIVYRIRGGWDTNKKGKRIKAEMIEFHTADRIITAVDPGLWHTDPELRRWYIREEAA